MRELVLWEVFLEILGVGGRLKCLLLVVELQRNAYLVPAIGVIITF